MGSALSSEGSESEEDVCSLGSGDEHEVSEWQWDRQQCPLECVNEVDEEGDERRCPNETLAHDFQPRGSMEKVRKTKEGRVSVTSGSDATGQSSRRQKAVAWEVDLSEVGARRQLSKKQSGLETVSLEGFGPEKFGELETTLEDMMLRKVLDQRRWSVY